MRVIADIRCLLDRPHAGVGTYAASVVGGLLREHADETAAWYAAARPHIFPELHAAENRIIYAHRPGKLYNALMLSGLATMDAAYPGATVFLPNLNFARVSLKAKLVVTAHDLSFERFPEFFTPKQRLWHAALRPRALYRRADAVIAVSAHTKRDLIELYDIPAERIRVIHSGVMPATTGSATLQLPKKYLLSVGTLEPRKNVESVVEAFTSIGGNYPDLHLIIAGGNGWKNKSVHELVRTSPYRERIRLLGYVPEADMPALYSGATAFVYPSFYEGFGFPALEAQSYGVPVIAGAHSALAETLGTSALLIQPDFIDSLTDALRIVLSEPETTHRLAEAGKQNAARYTWQKTIADTWDVLSGV